MNCIFQRALVSRSVLVDAGVVFGGRLMWREGHLENLEILAGVPELGRPHFETSLL